MESQEKDEARESGDWLIGLDDAILVTGATGFIGSRVVQNLLKRGFRNVHCMVRKGSPRERLSEAVGGSIDSAGLRLVECNLLSREDCARAVKDVRVIYHLAAGAGEKSYPDAFMNSVVTTRNLLEAVRQEGKIRRFVNVSSFTVYSNVDKSEGRWLDESCPIEENPELRGEAYTYAKIRQDDMVNEYGEKHKLPYVHLRPGVVYGPGKYSITGRVGIGTFGIFLHLGGSNQIPLTYVDNCAEAMVLAGLVSGVNGEVFNIVDDDLPTSRAFLRQYKKEVKRFPSIYLPHAVSYSLSCIWERYSIWSHEQLPPVFNRRKWNSYWRKSRYRNDKLKERLGWKQLVPTRDAIQNHFVACRENENHA